MGQASGLLTVQNAPHHVLPWAIEDYMLKFLKACFIGPNKNLLLIRRWEEGARNNVHILKMKVVFS